MACIVPGCPDVLVLTDILKDPALHDDTSDVVHNSDLFLVFGDLYLHFTFCLHNDLSRPQSSLSPQPTFFNTPVFAS